MGTNLFPGQSDRLNQILETLILQSGQFQIFADEFNHCLTPLRAGRGVVGEVAFVFALQLVDDSPSCQGESGSGCGKVEEDTRVDQSGAGRTHVHFFGAVIEENLDIPF